MHEIERTDAFTLVGGDAREGKVTLFEAEGPRDRGVLERIVLRVPRLEDVRERLDTAGHAARNGDTEIVRLLIEHGADANARNTRGHTVLYCAGGHGHLDTLRLLLNEGTDSDARFTDDCKALMEWLAQYPDDCRFKPITEALRQHMAGA